MHRRLPLLALAALAACQDYQFTPVGRCLIQPGRASVTANVGAVDLLFVVDDSVSMDDVQASLGNNFGAFITRLAQKQQARAAAGKDPLDIHIAVTSSSVLVNRGVAPNNVSYGTCGQGGSCTIDPVTFGAPYSYPCVPGEVCGDSVSQYYVYRGTNCTKGVMGDNGDPFPDGNFLAFGSNPKVLSFTKDLDWVRGTADPTIRNLMTRFGENVKVGSCGASQEMHFQGMRRAIEKALAHQQALPSGTAWPHPNSELAVVIVGNEDDCSTRARKDGGLVWDGGPPGTDTCSTDALRDPGAQKLTPIDEYVAFLTGLGRPLFAAFVRPGFASCGTGTRMQKLATALAGKGARVVEASVCDSNFASALESIAEGLEPPDSIRLPTAPAAGVVTQLRIQRADGSTVHVCEGPGTTRKEWWFVSCTTGSELVDQTDACIKLKQGGDCEPQPGETLMAEYLGRVPEQGCATAAQVSAECAGALGGTASAWSCVGASQAQRGTCVCAAN